MKLITYNDVLNTIHEKYDARSQRLIHKEIHVRALEYAIKKKIKTLNSEHGFGAEHLAIDDAAFQEVYRFVKFAETETALKAKRKKKESTASSDTFKALSSLLGNSKQNAPSETADEIFEKTAAVIVENNAKLQSGRLSSFAGAVYARPSILANLTQMLFDVGVAPDECISRIKDIDEIPKLYQFMNAICHVLLIIKAIASVDQEQGQAVARQLINKVRESDDVSIAEVIFYALSACAKQLFSDEYERIYVLADRDPAEKLLALERKFFNESLVKLIEMDKKALITFMEAVIGADADRLQALLQYFQTPNNIDLRLMNYSLKALTQQVNTGEVTQSPHRMRY
jgi:hypothetical protein